MARNNQRDKHADDRSQRGRDIARGAAVAGVAGAAGAAAFQSRGHDARDEGRDRQANAFADRDAAREDARRQYGDGRQWMRFRDSRDFRDNARPAWSPLIAGCPPGLAKKNNGCQPPGQAQALWGYSEPYRNWYTYPAWYRYDPGYDWRYDNGYLYRVDRTTLLVNAFLPLLGGALWEGQRWPEAYNDYAVDPYYDRYYGYAGDDEYRYADGAVFAVDRNSGEIDHVVALLTGDRWTVGSRLPDGYDVYNVPPGYRDRYFDTDQALYRYSDGYVYEIDPTTLLVRRALELLSRA